MQNVAAVKSENEATNLTDELRWQERSTDFPNGAWPQQEDLLIMQSDSRHPSPVPRLAEPSAASVSTGTEPEGLGLACTDSEQMLHKAGNGLSAR